MSRDTAIVDDTSTLRRLRLHLQETVLDAIKGRYEIDGYCLLEVFKVYFLERLCTNAKTGILHIARG